MRLAPDVERVWMSWRLICCIGFKGNMAKFEK
jgi:hypothetical protein